MDGRARRPALVSLLVALSLSATVCGTGRSTVTVSLEDFRIGSDKARVPAGPATFHIANLGGASSQSVHEFVLLRTNLSAGDLPTLPSGAVDQEAEGLTVVGEVEDIAPGGGATLEVDLEPGSYLAICNIRGHFAQGMVTGFTVR